MLLWSHYTPTIRKYIAASNQWATAFQTMLTNLDEASAVLTVTCKKNPLTYNYHLNQVQLERVTNEKDVGVTVTRTRSWDQHAHTIVRKANRLLGLLKRTCLLLTDLSVMRTLYLALVKSQLSYATQVGPRCKYPLKQRLKECRGERRDPTNSLWGNVRQEQASSPKPPATNL